MYFREQKQHIFRASAQILHAWRGGFADVVFHICLVRRCIKLLAVSILEINSGWREPSNLDSGQFGQFHFKG